MPTTPANKLLAYVPLSDGGNISIKWIIIIGLVVNLPGLLGFEIITGSLSVLLALIGAVYLAGVFAHLENEAREGRGSVRNVFKYGGMLLVVVVVFMLIPVVMDFLWDAFVPLFWLVVSLFW